MSLRTIAITAATATFALAGFAQAPAGHTAHHPQAAASAAGGMPMADRAGMDEQMKAMHEMHEKMAQAKTPEERSAVMAEHMKAMQDGMRMMDGMSSSGRGGMGGMKGMGDMNGMQGMSGDMGARQQMMERRMEMMQTMMQMMMDRMPASPAKQ